MNKKSVALYAGIILTLLFGVAALIGYQVWRDFGMTAFLVYAFVQFQLFVVQSSLGKLVVKTSAILGLVGLLVRKSASQDISKLGKALDAFGKKNAVG